VQHSRFQERVSQKRIDEGRFTGRGPANNGDVQIFILRPFANHLQFIYEPLAHFGFCIAA
jgi:hypothetical protein